MSRFVSGTGRSGCSIAASGFRVGAFELRPQRWRQRRRELFHQCQVFGVREFEQQGPQFFPEASSGGFVGALLLGIGQQPFEQSQRLGERFGRPNTQLHRCDVNAAQPPEVIERSGTIKRFQLAVALTNDGEENALTRPGMFYTFEIRRSVDPQLIVKPHGTSFGNVA